MQGEYTHGLSFYFLFILLTCFFNKLCSESLFISLLSAWVGGSLCMFASVYGFSSILSPHKIILISSQFILQPKNPYVSNTWIFTFLLQLWRCEVNYLLTRNSVCVPVWKWVERQRETSEDVKSIKHWRATKKIHVYMQRTTCIQFNLSARPCRHKSFELGNWLSKHCLLL